MKTTGTTQTNVMAMPTSTIFRIKTDAAALAAQLTSLVASAVGVRIEAVSNDEEVRVHVSLDEALHRRRRGWLLGEFDRQGCLARLLQGHLAEAGASVDGCVADAAGSTDPATSPLLALFLRCAASLAGPLRTSSYWGT